MNDRHNFITGFGAVILSALGTAKALLFPLRWVALGLLFLILIDLRFGVSEARQKHETIRCSRALRRTGNKIMDYAFLILLAGFIQRILMDNAIKFPYFSLICFVFIGIFEIESIVNHWLVLHGRKPIDFKTLARIFLHKSTKNQDIIDEYEKKRTKKQMERATKKRGKA